MVKQTYHNLSDEKKQELLDIAKKEFSEYPLYKASINRIIKEYGIARGSYYNYFDNIEDLFFCVIQDFKKNIDKRLESFFIKNEGDVFKSFEDLFDYLIEQSDSDKKLFRNIFLNMNMKLQESFLMNKEINKHEKPKFIKYVNMKLLKINNKFEMISLFEMLKNTTMHTLITSYMKDIPKDKANKLYKQKLQIIKYGICKEEKNVT